MTTLDYCFWNPVDVKTRFSFFKKLKYSKRLDRALLVKVGNVKKLSILHFTSLWLFIFMYALICCLFCFFLIGYSAFKMTGSSSAVNREDPRMSPRPSPRKGSFRPKEKAQERKDNDSLSIGSDSRSRSGSLSSMDSSDQLQEGRSKFERVMLSG